MYKGLDLMLFTKVKRNIGTLVVHMGMQNDLSI